MSKYGLQDFRSLVKKANEDISWYWDAVNEDLKLEWFEKYSRVFDSSRGIEWTKWFVGGKCNIVANCLDRHARTQPEKIAYVFEGNGSTQKITYRELDLQVSRLAAALIDSGVKKGDVVAIYLPMIPETFYAILACSKIGAIHSTIFSGFGSHALQARLADSRASVLITSDTMYRHGKKIDLKEQWTKATSPSNLGSKTFVRTIIDVKGSSGGSVVSYDDFIRIAGQSRAETRVMDSEDPLFILYTSGTTGQPKGTLQVHGGYMVVAAQQASYLVDMGPQDVLFWYADVGWITGQTWVVYGSTIIGGTSVVYEEALNYPNDRAWQSIISKHGVSILGMAPTAIRFFMRSKTDPDASALKSLRVLATTGEPINKEAWDWYNEKVGQSRCPVINLSGGTEAGGAILSPLPGSDIRPCSVGGPVPGFDARIYDDAGRPAQNGRLVIAKPWPSMTRGLVNSAQRFLETYWSRYHGSWDHGDLVFVDETGLWYIAGRSDDVIKVSGHRLSNAEIEAAAMAHPEVAEAAAVGDHDSIRGERIVLCVITRHGAEIGPRLREEISRTVEDKIGKFASPDEIRFVMDLPRTRTGKLIRRLIKARISGSEITEGDLALVENPSSVSGI
jgi:acetyl-CoA synthetase